MTSDFKGATVVLCAEKILQEQSALNPALSYTVDLCFSFLQYPTRLLSYIHSIYILQPKRLRLAAPGHPQGLHLRAYRLSVWLLHSGSTTLLPSLPPSGSTMNSQRTFPVSPDSLLPQEMKIDVNGTFIFFHLAKEVMTDDEKDCEDNTRHGSFLQSDPLRLTSIYLSIYLSSVAMEKLSPRPKNFPFRRRSG